jgi:hypothetical protein
VKKLFGIFVLTFLLTVFQIQPSNSATNGTPAAEGLAVKVYSSLGACTGAVWHLHEAELPPP